MKPSEKKLLEAAKASNGGGTRDDVHPVRAVVSCMKHGWVIHKKGTTGPTLGGYNLLVLTPFGRSALAMENAIAPSVGELVEKERTAKPEGPPNIFFKAGLPWE